MSEVARQVFGRVRWGLFGGFFEELRKSSVLNANVGAVSRSTWVAMGGPWAVLGSTWTPSWATAWPKCSFFGAFLVVSLSNCGILGPMCARFGLKCFFFWPCGVPKEAQDGVFKGAILKITECLQTILFTTLEACRRLPARSSDGFGGVSSEGFLKSFEKVRC